MLTQPAFAEQTSNADRVSDPSTADGNVNILGEGTTNTLNSGRIWADKSVFTDDTTIDGIDVSNDGDFLIIFSTLGSSTSRVGAGFDGIPSSPINGENGSLSYTDPLGEYMMPTGDVTLIQFGKSYRYEASSGSESTITFKPSSDEGIVNLSYGDPNQSFKLSEIAISAHKEVDSNCWIMNVTIPARALPLYLSILGFGAPDASGNQALTSFTTNAGQLASLPLRVAYSVGIDPALKNANGSLDFTKVSDEYQTTHLVQTTSGKGIAFYSNYYDDPTEVIAPDSTYGNAIVTVSPAADNNFYYFQDHLTVYAQGTPGTYNGDPVIFGSVSNPVTNIYDIQSNPQKTFYVVRKYYRRSGTGNLHNAYEVVAYAGSDLAHAVCYYDPSAQKPADSPGNGIVVATNVGCACMGNIAKFRTKKTADPTGTAAYSYYGEFIPSTSAARIFSIEAHYGNNGMMTVSYEESDALSISGLKQIEINGVALDPSTAGYGAFEFILLPNRGNPQGDPINANGMTVSSDANGVMHFDLGSYTQPGEYLYVIREIVPSTTVPGLTYDSTSYMLRVIARAGADGKILLSTSLSKNGAVLADGQQMAFVNAYDTDSIALTISGRVELEGADLFKGMFSFVLEPVSANDGTAAPTCPMPSAAYALNDESGFFSFGGITFVRAGEYVYRVLQAAPSPLVNADDYVLDASKYLVTFVVHNSASGPLYATTSMRKEGSDNSVDSLFFANKVKTPELVLTKTQTSTNGSTGSAIQVESGNVIEYRITLTNPSSIDARDVLLYDEIPNGLTFDNTAPSQAQGPYLRDGRLYWIIGTLAGGESRTVSFTLSVPNASPGTTWTNIAYAIYPNLLDATTTKSVASPAVLASYMVPDEQTPEKPGFDGIRPVSTDSSMTTLHAPRTDDNSTVFPLLVIMMLAALGFLLNAIAFRLFSPADEL